MRRTVVVVLIGIVAFGSGLMLGYKLDSDDGATSAESALPAAVEDTRVALLEAAESGDYEELRERIPSEGFGFNISGPAPDGPVAYWQEVEQRSDERPLDALAAILEMPYVLTRGYYVWPWAYSVGNADDLSSHEQGLLAPLGAPTELFPEGSGYLGWRAGIAPDGTWVFFVASD